MAPVEVTPAGGVPAGSPWARSPREIDETYAVLYEQLKAIAAGSDRTVEELTPGEHYALGVRAAALWSMGRLAKAPLADEELAPDQGSAAMVMALAESLITAEDTPDQPFALASGVHAWLAWLVGAHDRMRFRSID